MTAAVGGSTGKGGDEVNSIALTELEDDVHSASVQLPIVRVQMFWIGTMHS